MALPYPIAASQVDAKSPVDEQLMESIKLDLEYLDTQLGLSASFDYQFKVNGNLRILSEKRRKRCDGVLISQAATLQVSKLYLERPGTSGTLEVDARRIEVPNTPITGIEKLFLNNINTIARAGSALSTQSVTRATAQIATQSVAQWKAALNVSSIVVLGINNLVRYNLASATDSDWIVGDSITISGSTNPVNDGTFSIVRINDDGFNSIVVTNASGVAQSGAAGNIRLNAWSYTYINPVSTQFSAGEAALFSSHSDAGNNGTFTVYAINQSGNNIIVKNSAGVANGAAAGFADVNRWIFSFSSSAPSDYVTGEKAFMSSHSSGGNNGSFPITAVNSGGNNVIVYNTAGVVQGAPAGSVETLRWVYFFSTDPSTNVSVADRVRARSTVSANNTGIFTVVQVNRTTSDNVVVYNENGVSQGGSGGTLETTKTKIKFSSNQSAVYNTDSYVEVIGTIQALIDEENLKVVEVNRGGGANYNIVVDAENAIEQAGAGGRVILEEKSIFSTRPSLALANDNTNSTNRHLQIATNGVFNAYATVAANTRIAMYLTQLPLGAPTTCVLSLL